MSTHQDFPKQAILLLSGDTPDHVCTTIRTLAPLRAAGWRVIFGAVNLDRVQDVDAIVIQRDWPVNVAAYHELIQQANKHNKPIIYDLDDLLIALPASHPDYHRYRDCRAHIALAIADADLVTCSTPALASAIRAFAPDVQVLPNYLPNNLWQPILAKPQLDHDPSQPLRIGYCGGHAHSTDMEMIEPVLLDVLDEFKGRVQLWFWGLRPSAELLARDEVTWEPVSIGGYADFVDYFGTQQCDIFVAPIEDTLFNRCKSGLKFLEYSALGVPGIYSRLDPYQELVVHGENGFLAADLPEWRDYLRRLIVDAGLRSKMGKAAKETVASLGLLDAQAIQWQESYAHVIDRVAAGKRNAHAANIAAMAAWHDEMSDELAASRCDNADKEAAISALEERLRQTQAENAELYQMVHKQRQSLESIQHQLAIVQGSLGWQFIQTVTPLRYRLIPGGSYREQAIQSAVSRFQALRHDGIRGFLRKPSPPVPIDGNQQGHHQDAYGHSFTIEMCNDDVGIAPSVSVIVTIDRTVEPDDLVPMLDQWRTAQSMPVECVIWDPENNQGWSIEKPEQVWSCNNLSSLIDKTKGSYICLASPGLTQERATLVEENLVALLSEHLAFTLNVKDNPVRMESLLHKQMIPAGVHPPFGPSFVHRGCFDEAGHVDLTAWIDGMDNINDTACVGKLLVHTTDAAGEGNEPILIDLAYPPLRQMGSYVYSVSPSNSIAAGALSIHRLYPVDRVLPVEPLPTEKPTVLMIMPVLAVGGAEQVHLYMAEQIQHDIRLVIVALEPHIHGVGTSADQFRRYTPYVFTTDDFLVYPLMHSWIRYLIRRFQPETLYIANGANWIYHALPALREEFPGLHVAGQVYDANAGWINRYDAAMMKNFDAHIGTNQHIVAEFIRRGAKPEQVYLIEHCVDVDTFSPDRFSPDEVESLRERFGIPPGNRVVTFMARLHQQKRPMDFVELARRCASDDSITFLMVGNGPLQDAVDGEIARTGLSNIIRLPFHKPSYEVFAVTDVYVLPSEYEGMPLVILEAQAMGIPVIVTDVGNNREVIGVTGGGIVLDSIGNVNELRDGVLAMLASPPSPTQMRARTIDQLSQEFGILPEQMAEKYRVALLPNKGHS